MASLTNQEKHAIEDNLIGRGLDEFYKKFHKFTQMRSLTLVRDIVNLVNSDEGVFL